jgi:hypothetical protein
LPTVLIPTVRGEPIVTALNALSLSFSIVPMLLLLLILTLLLLVPRASHRYGSEGSLPEVPPNATLHFDIELLRVGAAPREILAHDSDAPFVFDGGRLPHDAESDLFDDAVDDDGEGGGDGGGEGDDAGMFEDAPDDATGDMFADADEDDEDVPGPGRVAAVAAPKKEAGSAVGARRHVGSIFDQLAGGGGGRGGPNDGDDDDEDEDDHGVERNGVVTFNISRSSDAAPTPEALPDVTSDDAFPSLLVAPREPSKPVWPKQAAPSAPSSSSSAARGALAAASAPWSTTTTKATTATTLWNGPATTASARKGMGRGPAGAGPASAHNGTAAPTPTTAGPPPAVASLGVGGTDGSPFPDRPDEPEDAVAHGDGVEAENSAEEGPPSDVLVVDTAGFLRDAPLHTLGREVYTIPEVGLPPPPSSSSSSLSSCARMRPHVSFTSSLITCSFASY